MDAAGTSWQALNAQANVLFQQQHAGAALPLYDQAVALADGREPKLFNNRANALLQLGRFEDALSDCNAALLLLASLPPSSVEEHQLHQQHTVKALVRKALSLIGLHCATGEPRALLHRCVCYKFKRRNPKPLIPIAAPQCAADRPRQRASPVTSRLFRRRYVCPCQRHCH
jgi:tetratricopeptide (TPR) repeat protein